MKSPGEFRVWRRTRDSGDFEGHAANPPPPPGEGPATAQLCDRGQVTSPA